MPVARTAESRGLPFTAAAAAACLWLAAAASPGPGASARAGELLIGPVRVVHGDGRVTEGATVSVRDGRVEAIGTRPAPDPGLLPHRRVIDGRGLTLVPGLIDAHVLLEPWMSPAFQKYGVTTIRDLAPGLLAVAASDAMGTVREAVRSRIEGGARVLFVPPGTEPAQLSTVVAAARARGVPVAADPSGMSAFQAADFGVTSIERLGGIAEAAGAEGTRAPGPRTVSPMRVDVDLLDWGALRAERLDAVARELAARGVTLVPTLSALVAASMVGATNADATDVPADVAARWVRDAGPMTGARAAGRESRLADALPRFRRFVTVFARAGGRVVAGSGAGQPFVVPGAGLHRELEQFVDAGLSPDRALRSATVDAAALLGIADRTGSIDAGMAADLLLVDGNPLDDVRALRRIVAVIKDGVVVVSGDRRR